MPKMLFAATASAFFMVSTMAIAAEKTVILAVENMTCAACPHIVRGSLTAVPGVNNVVISFTDKAATVTYDDTRASLPTLIRATTDAGYPSSPKS
jgi:mercuric ion binding protein